MSARRIEELFEQFRSQGDAAALGRVFDEVAPVLQRVARHLARDRAEAEDLVQATFLVAIEKRDTFDATRKLEPWLTGILLKQAGLARRARTRVIEPDRLDSRTSEDPLDVAGAREMSETLTVALSRLSPSDREVLLPLLLDGRRAVEIARELGRRPDTVHMRIHRGLARLRRLLPASFAIALWTRSSHARGLGAVKAEVLRQAHAQLGTAAGAGVSIAVTTWGIAMTTKQIGLAVAALAVSLAVGGFLFVPGLRGQGEMTASSASTALEPSAVDGSRRARDEVAMQPSTGGSGRTALPLITPPATTRHVELEVIRSDHQPATGALIALMDASNTLSSAKTDEKGLCTFAATDGAADLYVREAASQPFHERIEIGKPQRLTIELPRGQALSGQFRMSTGARLPEFELRLSPNNAPEGFAEADMTVFKALALMRYDSKDLSAVLSVRTDGLFCFPDLPSTWSGTLKLPKELVFVVDGKPSGSSEHVCTAPAVGVQLEITYRPRILGRIVDAVTHAPIASTSFNGVVEFSDGNSTMYGVDAGSDGRFTIALDYRTDVIGFAIDRVQLSDGRYAYSKEKLNWSGPCTPFDAGDLEFALPAARRLEIRVVDSDGKPLPGARAKSGDLDVVTTDKNGIGVFNALPLDAITMRVCAIGHAIASIPLTNEMTSRLDVALVPTNKLAITLPPESMVGSPLSISLVSTSLLFGGTTRMYDWVVHGETVGKCTGWSNDSGTEEGHVDFAFSEDGRIEVEDIRTGIPFRVILHRADAGTVTSGDEVMVDVHVDSIGPREQRRIDLTVPQRTVVEPHLVHGRAVDERGEPVTDALVSTHPEYGYWSASTGLDGEFSLNTTDRKKLDVFVSKRGYVPFRVHDWNVNAEQRIEARLTRGQDLRVELVDPRSRSVQGAKVAANIDGFGAPWRIEAGSAGVFTLCDLPDGIAHITIQVAGREYVRSSDAHARVARITLPEFGRLDVSWTFDVTKNEGSDYQLALRPIGSDCALQTQWTPGLDRLQGHTFESVLPGVYTVGLEAGTHDDPEAPYVYVPLHAPSHITIVGGETRTVTLTP